MRAIGKTLVKWKSEIKASFIKIDGRRISNGPIESTNNKIKTTLKPLMVLEKSQDLEIEFYILSIKIYPFKINSNYRLSAYKKGTLSQVPF